MISTFEGLLVVTEAHGQRPLEKPTYMKYQYCLRMGNLEREVTGWF